MRPLPCLLGFHRWQGCVCTRCGLTRRRGHDWAGCTCRLCNARREIGHSLGKGCRCLICGRTIHSFVQKDRYRHRCRRCGLEQAHHFRTYTRWEDVGGWDEIGPWREAEITVHACEQCAFEESWELTGRITF